MHKDMPILNLQFIQALDHTSPSVTDFGIRQFHKAHLFAELAPQLCQIVVSLFMDSLESQLF
jgi:hypothetical protein